MNADAVAALRERFERLVAEYELRATQREASPSWEFAAEDIRVALAAAPLPEPVYDFAWLIERGQPEGQVPTVWWWLAAGGREGWTEVATEAFHFESREAAEEIIAAKFTPPTSRGEASARAVEHSFIAAAPLPSADGLDAERLGFTDLLDIGTALLEHYPPDTIVCSHSTKADIGAQTVAGIADLIASCRLALTQEPRSTREEDE